MTAERCRACGGELPAGNRRCGSCGTDAGGGAARHKRLGWRKRLLFSGILGCLLLGFCELGLQVVYRLSVGMWLQEWWAIPIYEPDPVRVYRVKANLDFLHKTREFTARYTTDSAGMRTEPGGSAPLVPKPANKFRVLALGPSFAFGWGANHEDAYVVKVARGLRVPGKVVELINLGTPSQPISYQLRWLKQVGASYQPDLILQTVYGSPETLEPDDTLPPVGPVVKDGHLFPAEDMTASMWVRRLRRYSALLFFGWHLKQAATRSGAEAPADGREFYRRTEPTGGLADLEWGEAVRRHGAYSDFVRKALPVPPAIVFLHIPFSYVVHPADLVRVAHHGSVRDPVEIRQRTDRIVTRLNGAGFCVLDPTAELVERDRRERMYHLYDIHFTVAGNQAVAQYSLPLIQNYLDLLARGPGTGK